MKTLSKVSLFALGAVLFVAACDSADSPAGPLDGPGGIALALDTPFDKTTDNSPHLEWVKVCKYGTDASFTYDIEDLEGIDDRSGGFSLVDGECMTLVRADGPGASVTVTEDLTALGANEQFDNLDVTTLVEGNAPVTASAGTNSATVIAKGGAVQEGAVLEFYNSVIPTGGEGCTPGYWKNHAGPDSQSRGGQNKPSSWPPSGLDPNDDYDATFVVASTFGGTLMDALQRGGGGENALGRHAVAALLNASHGGVSYDLSPAEVLALVQGAYASGDYEGAKNILAAFNEQGCPLGNGI